jgi:hypothetical protein
MMCPSRASRETADSRRHRMQRRNTKAEPGAARHRTRVSPIRVKVEAGPAAGARVIQMSPMQSRAGHRVAHGSDSRRGWALGRPSRPNEERITSRRVVGNNESGPLVKVNRPLAWREHHPGSTPVHSDRKCATAMSSSRAATLTSKLSESLSISRVLPPVPNIRSSSPLQS